MVVRLQGNVPDLQREIPISKSQYDRVWRFLAARLANGQDGQELAQEAYLRLIRASDSKLIRDPAAYLYRIADNLLHEWYSSRPPLGEPLESIELADEGISIDWRAGPTRSPKS